MIAFPFAIRNRWLDSKRERPEFMAFQKLIRSVDPVIALGPKDMGDRPLVPVLLIELEAGAFDFELSPTRR